MRERAWILGLVSLMAGCSGGSFDVAAAADGAIDDSAPGDGPLGEDSDGPDVVTPDSDTPPLDSSVLDSGSSADSVVSIDSFVPDTATTPDTLTPIDSTAIDSAMPDTFTMPDSIVMSDGVTTIDATPTDGGLCAPVGPSSINVYVNASASAATAKGSSGCPFKTLRAALAVAKNSGVVRTIHVASGNYFESDVVGIGGDITVVSEGGPSNIAGGSSSNCGGIGDRCVVRIEGNGTLDGFVIDASGVAVGMAAGSATTPAKLLNSTIKSAQKIGLVAFDDVDVSAVHIDDNTDSNVWVRNGTFHVLPGANTFDRSKGKGGVVSGSYVPSAGIVVFGSAILNFEGGTANDNQAGIQLDYGSGSTSTQSITGLTATGNRAYGFITGHNQKSVIIRKSTLVKNTIGGAYFDYDGTASNVFDLGTLADPGGNDFGGTLAKNGKVGVFVCHGPLTLSAEGDQFASCPPTQVSSPSCDTMPVSYTDVGYVPLSGASSGTLVDTTCTVGP